MADIAIFGDRGSGKTTLALFLSRYMQTLNKDIEIYTNANVEQENGVYTIHDLLDIPMDRKNPRILIVDEAMMSIDSRSSSSKQNRLFSAWLAYVRRFRFIHVILITHRPNMIDVRFRDSLDFSIFARDDGDYYSYLMIEVVTEFSNSFRLIKHPDMYLFAKFDTYDFPNILSTKKLSTHPLFINI